MKVTKRRLLCLLFAWTAVASMLGCELIVRLDDGLVDSGRDVGIVCTICEDAPFDVGVDARPDQGSAPEAGQMDAVSEKSTNDAAAP